MRSCLHSSIFTAVKQPIIVHKVRSTIIKPISPSLDLTQSPPPAARRKKKTHWLLYSTINKIFTSLNSHFQTFQMGTQALILANCLIHIRPIIKIPALNSLGHCLSRPTNPIGETEEDHGSNLSVFGIEVVGLFSLLLVR